MINEPHEIAGRLSEIITLEISLAPGASWLKWTML